jgi:hypothetical protein
VAAEKDKKADARVLPSTPRFEEARKSLREMEKTIQPYVKKERIVRDSSGGRWQSTCSLPQ